MERLPPLYELAVRLIDVASPTGEEAAVTDVVAELLDRLGLEVRRQRVAEGRENLLATAERDAVVLLNSHLDTVPPFFPSSEDKDFIYGRGACDTKGILAAMLKAGESLLGDGEKRFGFLFVVGEETDHCGAIRAAEELELPACRFVVVGEPTENRFASAQKGALRCTLRTQGRSAHSAYPERGESAIDKLLDALQRIRAEDWGRDPRRGPTTVNIGTLAGGRRANIIPDKASAELMFRVATSLEAVESRLRELVESEAEIDALASNPPQDLLVPEGQPSEVVAFNTDVPWLRHFGEALLVGPGSILDAHGPRERVGKTQLDGAVGLYRDTVRSLLAQTEG